MADRRRWVLAALVAAALCAAAASIVGPGRPSRLGGTVTLQSGDPVPGATVRIQTTRTSVATDERGRFSLPVPEPGEPVRVTAWAEGHYIVGGSEHAPGEDVSLVLIPLFEEDDDSYEWLSYEASPEAPAGGEDQGCSSCHSRGAAGLPYDLPVDQWLDDAHAGSAVNPRFLTMYSGTDVHGNTSQPTRYVPSPDYGEVPIRPDPSLPYYGPGYRLDFPDTFGNCAACHTPAAAVDDPYGVDPTTVTGVDAEGIGCDFCHKVWEVHLDEVTGLPLPNRPGVLSMEFRRPPEGHQYFGGPYDDVAPGEDTYVPAMSDGAYCAPCHHSVFWDTLVYDSYGEWLASPYSDPATGRTCQDCHMPPTGAPVFAAPDAGGLERDPATIPGHRMPGAADADLLGEALTMTVLAERVGDRVDVEVTLLNDLTGHHVPTDSPLRHLILLVEAAGPGGALEPVAGPVLPDWCGRGDPADGRYAGLPGTAYAKVLEELWTEISPTGAYWNPTRVVSDNRIPAMGSDTTVYHFAGADGDVTVEVTLLFRRAFIDLADQKGWEIDDIVMESETVLLPTP